MSPGDHGDGLLHTLRLPGWSRKSRPDLLFIWIPKTAGSSVFSYLESQLGMKKLKTPESARKFRNHGSVTFGHMSYQSLLESGIVSNSYHARAFKFALVRNPYARIASLYNYLMQRKIIENVEFDRYLENVRLRPPIGLYNRFGGSLANPQTDWLMDKEEKFLTDRVFKVEEMDEFARFLETGYAIDFHPDNHHNSSYRIISVEEITGHAERREIINDLYARDFDLLGYKKLGSA